MRYTTAGRAVGAAALGAALILSTVAPADAATRPVGFKIAKTGKASGGWIGSYTYGKHVAYRIDPARKSIRTTYGRPLVTADLHARKAPSASATQRAAYILSVYGHRGGRDQRAAVDASVQQLLTGGRWNVKGRHGAKRIRQTRTHARTIRSYSRQMMAAANAKAGAHAITVAAGGANAGGGAPVTATVTNARTRKPIAGKLVRFTYRGATTAAYTDSRGVARATVSGVPAGLSTVTATAVDLPEWRLNLRYPKRSKATRLALAGQRVSISGRATIGGTSAQTITIANATSLRRVGQALAGTYTITGGTGDRDVTRRVYGPFASSSNTCERPVPHSSTAVSGGGTTALPAFAPTTSGYYRWGVEAASNALTLAASACGAPVRVQRQASVSQYRPEGLDYSVKVGQPWRVGVTVAGFDRAESHTITSRVYGPYSSSDAIKCVESKRVGGKNQTRNITGNGSWSMGAVTMSQPGYYGWQTTLSSGELILGGVTGCATRTFRVVK